MAVLVVELWLSVACYIQAIAAVHAVAAIDREENDIGWFAGDDAGEDYFGAEQGNDDWQERD